MKPMKIKAYGQDGLVIHGVMHLVETLTPCPPQKLGEVEVGKIHQRVWVGFWRGAFLVNAFDFRNIDFKTATSTARSLFMEKINPNGSLGDNPFVPANKDVQPIHVFVSNKYRYACTLKGLCC